MDKAIEQRFQRIIAAVKAMETEADIEFTKAELTAIAVEQIADTLTDIKRIADALEKISNVELHMEKVGSVAIMFMGSAEKAEVWRKENKPDE